MWMLEKNLAGMGNKMSSAGHAKFCTFVIPKRKVQGWVGWQSAGLEATDEVSTGHING